MVGWLGFWIYLGLLPLTIAEGATSQRNFRFVVTEFNFKPMVTDLFEDLQWKVENNNTVSTSLILSRIVDQLDADTSMDMLRPNNQTLRIYQIRLDACQFLTNVHKNRLFNLFAKTLIRGSNFILRCPLNPHFNYTMSNMRLDEADFPQYVPECQFKSLTKFYIHNQFVLRQFLAGRVENIN